MKNLLGLFAIVIILFVSSCSSGDTTLSIRLDGVERSVDNVPINAQIELPGTFQDVQVNEIGVTLKSADGAMQNITGQVTEENDGQHRLWWVVPAEGQAVPMEWEASFYRLDDTGSPKFMWHDDQGKHLDLLYDGKKVFRYEYELDDQFVLGETLTAKNRVFYHIYDLSGERLITNGYEEGVWSHHRGIMIGWRDVTYQDQKLSFWGMEQLTTQKHIEFLKLTVGPVLARVKSRIHWNDSTDHTILEETRTATIYHQPAPVIATIDFTSQLTAVAGDVNLAGDSEHGGVQFRAHNDIAAETPGSKKASYFFHQDGIDPTEDHNLPWVGMSYDLDHKTYSVVEMSAEGNPQPAIWSAYRDYGRFGPYFSKNLADGESFEVNFRFLVRESAMPSRAEIDAQYEWYTEPPETDMK